MYLHHPSFFDAHYASITKIKMASDFLKCDSDSKFIYTTPQYSFRTHGAIEHIQPPNQTQTTIHHWLDQARVQLEASKWKDAHLVGAIGFDNAAPAELMVSEYVDVVHRLIFEKKEISCPHIQKVNFLPSEQTYKTGVQQLTDAMKRGILTKAVLARVLEVSFAHEIDVSQVFESLVNMNPEGFNYALATKANEHGWFVGASPEVLIAKQGGDIWSQPVAGTMPRHKNQQLDQQNAQSLLNSEKDHLEHQLVIEMIADHLTPFCKKLTVPKTPTLIQTHRVWHLATHIHAELKNKDTHVFELIKVLHPTPAVCGQPPSKAKQYINELEQFDRELFAGAMGWADREGNGSWSVTVRCARLFQNMARLFAGAGIVEQSEPSSEYTETLAKFGTLLDGLNVNLNTMDLG